MGVGVAGVGYTAVDLRPRLLRPELRSRPPGYRAKPFGWERVGGIAAIVFGEDECEAFGEKAEYMLLSGVVYYGNVNGWVGIARKLSLKPKTPLAARQAISQFIENVFEAAGFEKDLRRIPPELLAEDEMFTVAAVMDRTRYVPILHIPRFDGHVAMIPWLKHWGNQWSPCLVARPALSGVGMITPKAAGISAFGAGFRFWAVGAMGPWRSSAPKRIDAERPNIKRGFRNLVCNDGVDAFRVWKDVWWSGDWIECGG